jgi:hypothetical protein
MYKVTNKTKDRAYPFGDSLLAPDKTMDVEDDVIEVPKYVGLLASKTLIAQKVEPVVPPPPPPPPEPKKPKAKPAKEEKSEEKKDK